jgi:hypothetical protein
VGVSACTKVVAVGNDGEVKVLCLIFYFLEREKREGMVICRRWDKLWCCVFLF